MLLHEHRKLLPEAKQFQERALKITKATEQLVASGCFAGEEASEQSYTVLSATSDYLTDLQNRESLLERVIGFFRTAHTVSNNDCDLSIVVAHKGYICCHLLVMLTLPLFSVNC